MPLEATDRPRLRPGLSASRDARSTEHVYLYDTWRQSPQPLRLTLAEFRLVEQMNGQRAVAQLLETSLALPASGGEAMLHSLISRLENRLYLDGPSWQARLAASVREPSCLGTYAPDAVGLRKQLLELFNAPQSSGLPDPTVKPNGPPPSSAGATHRLWSRRAHLYLGIQGTGRADDGFAVRDHWHFALQPTPIHADAQRLKTPLGVVPTDQDYIDRLEKHYGPGLFADEFQAHLPEHSIELEVVLLQYLMEKRWPIRIVPLVVGSFQDAVLNREAPSRSADIERMMKAIVEIEAELPEPPAYIISGDLAHIGPKFGDSMAVHHDWLTQSRLGDEALINAAEAADFATYADIITEEQDRRAHLRLPADLHAPAGAEALQRQAVALRSIHSSTRVRERQFRQHGVL